MRPQEWRKWDARIAYSIALVSAAVDGDELAIGSAIAAMKEGMVADSTLLTRLSS